MRNIITPPAITADAPKNGLTVSRSSASTVSAALAQRQAGRLARRSPSHRPMPAADAPSAMPVSEPTAPILARVPASVSDHHEALAAIQMVKAAMPPVHTTSPTTLPVGRQPDAAASSAPTAVTTAIGSRSSRVIVFRRVREAPSAPNAPSFTRGPCARFASSRRWR